MSSTSPFVGEYAPPPQHPSIRDAREERERRAIAERDARLAAERERSLRDERERKAQRAAEYAALTPATEAAAIDALLEVERSHGDETVRYREALARVTDELRAVERSRTGHEADVERLRVETAVDGGDADALKRARKAAQGAADRIVEIQADAEAIDRAMAKVDSKFDREQHRKNVALAQRRMGEALLKQALERVDVREVLLEAYTARSLGGDAITWDYLLRRVLPPPHESEVEPVRARLLGEWPQLDGRLR